MTLDVPALSEAHRVLFEVELTPLQGERFQPTGFPDLGPATYQAGDKACLLVESAQSMANRLEGTIWDEGSKQLTDDAAGLSYVTVQNDSGEYLTSSITESHRLNSPYILENSDKTFLSQLKESLSVMETGPIDRRLLAETLLRYDVNSLLHGVFLAKKELAGGRLRVARAISSFIEAECVQSVASGGVKMDHVNPKGDTGKGFGHVPFHREEFTAERVTAFVSIDLQQIRGYGLGDGVERLLTVLAFYKVRALFDGNLRLRTACDFEAASGNPIMARRPEGFELPSRDELRGALRTAIEDCSDRMESVTITYKK